MSMFTKRVFYLTTQQLSVYHWQDDRLYDPFVFSNDEAGYRQFNEYVAQQPQVVSYFLVDLIEEDFKNDLIPHVGPKDRKTLIQRKLSQQYRSTPFRVGIMHGRDKDNRRQDKVLYTALTNPDLLTPWLEATEKNKIPVAGIYSIPLISQYVLRVLNLDAENLLLITQQKDSGIRQTFFNKKKLKISRISTSANIDTENYAATLESETEKTKRYLTRLRLITRDSPLNICILGHGETLENLPKHNLENTNTHYHFVDTADLAKNIGLKFPKSSMYCDELFIHQFLKRRPAANYAGISQTRYYKHRQIRTGLYGLCAAAGITALSWSGINLIDGLLLNRYGEEAARLTQTFTAAYQSAINDIPQTPVEPAGLKEGVNTARTLLNHKMLPMEMMLTISQGLAGFSDIRIDSINWIATTDPNASVESDVYANNPNNEYMEVDNPNAVDEENSGLYQVAEVSGKIKPFDGNYRKAFETIDRFVKTLKHNKKLIKVSVGKFPLDINPQTSLKGESGSHMEKHNALFNLKVVLKVRDGAI